MKFPYFKLRDKLAPMVPIELKGEEWVSYDAYVDSGAGYSIFHSDAADDLEIKLGSLVSRVAMANAYKEIVILSKSPHSNLGDFPGI